MFRGHRGRTQRDLQCGRGIAHTAGEFAASHVHEPIPCGLTSSHDGFANPSPDPPGVCCRFFEKSPAWVSVDVRVNKHSSMATVPALQINPDYDVFWRGVANLWFMKETGLDLGFGVSHRVTSSSVLALDPSPEHVAQIILSRWLRFYTMREPSPQTALLQRVARWYGGMAMCAYAGDCVGWNGAKKWVKVLTNEAASMLSGYSDSTDDELRQAWKGEELREDDMPAEEMIRRVKTITGLDLTLVDVNVVNWSDWIAESTSSITKATPAVPQSPAAAADAFKAHSSLSSLSSFSPPPIGLHKEAYCKILIPAAQLPRSSGSRKPGRLCVFKLGDGGIFVFEAPPVASRPWWQCNSTHALLRGATIAAEQGGLHHRAVANIFPVDPDSIAVVEAAVKEAVPEPAVEAKVKAKVKAVPEPAVEAEVEAEVGVEFILSLILSPSSAVRDELWSRMRAYASCPRLQLALGLVNEQGVPRDESHLNTYRGKDGWVQSDLFFANTTYVLHMPLSEMSACNELASRCKLGLWVPSTNLIVGFAGDRLGYAARLVRGHLTRGQKIGGSQTSGTLESSLTLPFKAKISTMD